MAGPMAVRKPTEFKNPRKHRKHSEDPVKKRSQPRFRASLVGAKIPNDDANSQNAMWPCLNAAGATVSRVSISVFDLDALETTTPYHAFLVHKACCSSSR